MKQGKLTVTLVSSGQAQPGSVFIHRGPGSKCEGCEYFHVCIGNLEPGRIYRIVKVRRKTLACRQYESQMRVAEVVAAELPVAVPAKQAIEGAMITLSLPKCGDETCENHELCFPMGLENGDRCEILEITQSLRCSEGSLLKRVVLRRSPVS